MSTDIRKILQLMCTSGRGFTGKRAASYGVPWLQPAKKTLDTGKVPGLKLPWANKQIDFGGILDKLIKNPYPVVGAAGGAGLGAMLGGKNKLLSALLGALAGGAGGYAAGKIWPGHTMLPKVSSVKLARFGALARAGSSAGRAMKPNLLRKLFTRPQVKPPAGSYPMLRTGRTPPAPVRAAMGITRARMQMADKAVALRRAQREAGPMRSPAERMLPWLLGGSGTIAAPYAISRLFNRSNSKE